METCQQNQYEPLKKCQPKSGKVISNFDFDFIDGIDKLLIDLVEKHGAERWSFISSFFPERVGKQCRERWFNHLNPNVKKSTWTKEEEWILFLKHKLLGNKWSKLCEFLPGRTDNTIKNHWNSTMQKRIIVLEKELEDMLKDKSEEDKKKTIDDFLEQCKVAVASDNIKFYDEKRKNYEKFKNVKTENKQIMNKLKKILLFRTHSKKTKKKGRKRKIFIRTYIEEKPANQPIIQPQPIPLIQHAPTSVTNININYEFNIN